MMHFSKVQCPEYQLGGLNGLEAHILSCALRIAPTPKITKVLLELHNMDVTKEKVDKILCNLEDVIERLLGDV